MVRLGHLESPIEDGRGQLRFSEDYAELVHPDAPIKAAPDGVVMALDFASVYRDLQRVWGPMESFSLRHMAMAACVAPICVESWERKAIIGTTAHRGRGNRKKYGFAELVAVCIIGALRRRGVSLNACRAVHRFIIGNPAPAAEGPGQGSDQLFVEETENLQA
jgi:hypothetical protein